MDRIQYSVENFKNMQDMIKFADQKAGALLVVYGFVLTIFSDNIKLLAFGFDSNKLISIMIFIIGASLILLLIVQILHILLCILMPRLAKNYSADESCLFYFEHVAASEKSDIIKCLVDMDENKMMSDVSGQIFELSKVLERKMQGLRKAVQFAASMIILLIAYVLTIKML